MPNADNLPSSCSIVTKCGSLNFLEHSGHVHACNWTALPLLTYLLTPWCTVLLEKLTGLQLVKKFPAFYGTRRFITALTSVRHLSLSWASPIQSTYPHSTLEIHPNIIHPSMPRSPQWSLSLRFPHQDPIRPPLLTHTRRMPSPSHSSRFYHPHNIGYTSYRMWPGTAPRILFKEWKSFQSRATRLN